MAKAVYTSVLSIKFLVMFGLGTLSRVRMGCTASMGPCEIGKNCTLKCRATFGENANGFCDRSSGGAGECVCVYPCPPNEAHI
ncbi:hypothetical protein EUTSA_v10002324mg [Eutrema salsugineum]|uniref:Defensin-like protein n=1 Tax=Eutrema salsugineum TaxID=72664 RepID=V4MD12_EUTSA|nr:hypothetical protein EUTSA_v10002324mg [Eutrema salsugineum]